MNKHPDTRRYHWWRPLPPFAFLALLLLILHGEARGVGPSPPASKGSYAPYPPAAAGREVIEFATKTPINVAPGERRPIPTNDWWSTDYGALAALPNLIARFTDEAPGAELEVISFSPDVFRALADGQIDMLLYSDKPVPS